MSTERWQRVEALFHATLDQPASRRRAWLAEACPDAELRAEVEHLLASAVDSGEGAFIEDALRDAATGMVDTASRAGQQFGAWRLIREVGHGGMGSVWLAERADEAYSAQVAIKFVRGAFLSPELARRFRAERQILADLQHPNIARLVDGGAAPDGTPFLAMEYVPGEPITHYAWSKGLDLEARLRLFLTVCDAVQQAHRALIVHRDLKPSNILVDENGEPKLVDFGIAKLVDEAGGDETTGLMRPMTPAYASPEQIRGERVTVSSDVFSLGVVLYELLTGEQPFRSDSATTNDVQRRILEQEATLPSVAAARATEHTKVVSARSLVGDVDNIVMMALRKEPERRYATVEQLADDVRRYLDGQPVRARAATAAYRIRKFVKRNRARVTATAASVILITTLVTFYTLRLQRERDVAQRERATAEQVTTFLTDMFREADPARALGETLTVRQALDRGRERLATELADQPRVRARLLNTIGNTYVNLAAYAAADTVLREALALVEEVNGPDDAQTANVLHNLAMLEYRRSRVDAGREYAERSIRIREANRDSTALGSSLSILAWLIADTHPDSAQTLLDRVLAMQQAETDTDPLELAQTRYSLATVRLQRDDFRGALNELHQVNAIRDSALPPNHPTHAATFNVMAIAYNLLGIPDSARDLQERALAVQRAVFGPDHPETALALNNLASAMQALGQRDSALALLQHALDIRIRYFGEEHVHVANTLLTIGSAYGSAGNHEEAIPYYQRAIAVYENVLPADHRDLHFPHYNAGVALNGLDRHAEAVPHLRRAYEIAEKAMGADNSSSAITLQALGVARKALGDTVEAKQLFEESLARLERALGSEHIWLTYPVESLAETHVQQHEFRAAAALYERYRPLLEKRYAADPEALATALEHYARASRALGDTTLADSLSGVVHELTNRR